MYRACIAVVDASRARLFTFERVATPEGISEELIEQSDLVNPARRLRPSELLSDTHTGSSHTGSLQFGFDDHRDAHVDELDAEFSRTVTSAVAALLHAAPAQRLIVCASPRMLGKLRDTGRDLARNGLVVDEISRDLTKLPAAEIRDHLTSYGLLPATT